MSKRILPATAILTLVYVAVPGAAHAYIDPGTGSILLQGLVGSAATGMVLLRMYGARTKHKIAALFSSRKDGRC